jgi:hypothetical protein
MDIVNYIGTDTASKFILPMVMKPDATYEDVPKTFYKTCISIFDKPEFDDHIILVSTSSKDLLKGRLNLSLRRIYDEESKDFLFIYEIPTEYENDLYKVTTGDYSSLSEPYKQKLLHFWKEDDNSPLYGLLYNNISLRYTKDQRLKNVYEIVQSRSYYPKPTLRELIYGIGGN